MILIIKWFFGFGTNLKNLPAGAEFCYFVGRKMAVVFPGDWKPQSSAIIPLWGRTILCFCQAHFGRPVWNHRDAQGSFHGGRVVLSFDGYTGYIEILFYQTKGGFAI